FWDRVRGERWIWHVQLCMQLCRALEYAHSRGVLHRDVKPENVIVGEFGEVVLLDWGVAVRIEQTADLPADHIAGTPAFMAPEMLSPERGEIGPATDVYLLGASLHHALVGRPPHHHDSLVATFTSVAESAPPEYGPEIERELARILRRAMDRDPSARFEGPAELREALEDALRHRASVQLTTEAIRRLEAMEAELEGPAPNPGTIREHFETARFGLEQALEGWPENLEAQLQLAQALERMATLEIASRHTGAARALLRSLESCAEPAAERIRAMLLQLEAEVEAEQAEQSRLRRLELELDPGVSRAQRRVAAGALGGAAIVGASALLITDALGLVEISALGLVGIALAALMASSLGLFLFRHFFFRNRINRVMSGFLVFLLLGLLGHRLHGLSIDQPVWQILAGDGILIATVSALAGVVLHLRFFLPAILMGAGAAAASSWHERAFTLIALAGIASIASILLWRPDVGTVEEKR
ncbi:MAG: serine/threonine protein kinase, partial [Myxococcales bacterium]|nr:serine/threonine protein kinase [Myxococcales bacterium]